MPTKMGVNGKAEAARARKSARKTERKEQEARQKQDQYWLEAEGPKSSAARGAGEVQWQDVEPDLLTRFVGFYLLCS